MYTEQKGLLAFVMRLAVRVLLGLKVYIVKWNDTPVWELKLNSFPMTIINEDMFGNKVPKEFMLDPNMLKDKKVLFLGSRFEIDCEETKDKVVLTNNLMDMLKTEFKGQYSIKAHPIDKTLYGTMKSSQYIIPAHILAESLWGHNWEFVIGYHSEALVSAKLNTKAKVISLIKMYEFTNPKVRQYWLDTFEKNGILMPSNLEELKCHMMITKKEKS
jgi:hypothetical protein